MKKINYKKFGKEEVLQLSEVPTPQAGKGELLIRVKSVSINPLDWKIYRGEMKLMSGSKFPKSVGIDFSGVVHQAGDGVTRFQPSDEVFGLVDIFKEGALAEYIVVKETQVARKPSAITFEQAAALGVSGLSALQILEDMASVSKGQQVLINGASGGIGVVAIQLAKRHGAMVTAVATGAGIDLAAKFGADHVIDYKTQGIASAGRKFDVVIDLSGKLSFRASQPTMNARAIYINTLPSPIAIIGSALRNIFSRRKFKVLILKPKPEALDRLSLLAGSDLKVYVDKVFSIEQTSDAYRQISAKGATGKAVINVS